MSTQARNYFKYLNLIRENIREELDSLEIQKENLKICDFGCGNGITTFGLALEAKGSVCTGVDLFNEETGITIREISRYIEIVKDQYHQTVVNPYPDDLWKLINDNRTPKFQAGNIVLNKNLPNNIDLAYCKKVLINIMEKEYAGTPSGEQGLLAGLRNIAKCVRSNGWLCAVEYDKEFILEKYFELCGLRILRLEQIKRREIRSKGRTKTISTLTLYLCQKSL
jgi:SAM-dependent methyltransferase